MVLLALKLSWGISQASHMRFRDFCDFLHEIKSKVGKFEKYSSRIQESWLEKQLFTNENLCFPMYKVCKQKMLNMVTLTKYQQKNI